jgi:hypothetical protein
VTFHPLANSMGTTLSLSRFFCTPLETYSISVTFSQEDILVTTPKMSSFSKHFETHVPNILKLHTDNESHYENENQPEFI